MILKYICAEKPMYIADNYAQQLGIADLSEYIWFKALNETEKEKLISDMISIQPVYEDAANFCRILMINRIFCFYWLN